MIRKIIISSVLGLLACNYQSATITDSCTVEGVELLLLQSGDESILKISREGQVRKEKLQLKPPCYFMRTDKGIQSFTYKNKGTKVVMVTGALLKTEDKVYLGASEDMVCGGQAQGILFRNDSVLISRKVLKGGMFCKDYGLDEKDFWTLAHDK